MKYIATFISKYKYNNFSFDELVSICEMLKIKNLKIDETFNYDIQHIPYITLSILMLFDLAYSLISSTNLL